MKLKFVIANRRNVLEIMRREQNPFYVIAVANPFPDSLDYNIGTDLFTGVHKFDFFDTDESQYSDRRYIFKQELSEQIVELMKNGIEHGVDNYIIHFDKGLHRSVAIAMGLKYLFEKKHTIVIENLQEKPEPNMFVLGFFMKMLHI